MRRESEGTDQFGYRCFEVRMLGVDGYIHSMITVQYPDGRWSPSWDEVRRRVEASAARPPVVR